MCNIHARNVISLLTEPVKYFSYISSLVSQIVIEQIQFQENLKRNVSVFPKLNLLVHSKDQIENIRNNSLIQISTASSITTLTA